MRALLVLALLLTVAAPVRAQPLSCVVHTADWQATRYVVKVPHEDVALRRSYTAEPPVAITTQHYITATLLITLSATPLITTTVWTFDYSETIDLLGYTPFTAHPPDYAYFIASPAPFRVWACAAGAPAPHLFIPIARS